MLATILKGDKAIEATISIIEAFAKLRELWTETEIELNFAVMKLRHKVKRGGK